MALAAMDSIHRGEFSRLSVFPLVDAIATLATAGLCLRSHNKKELP